MHRSTRTDRRIRYASALALVVLAVAAYCAGASQATSQPAGQPQATPTVQQLDRPTVVVVDRADSWHGMRELVRAYNRTGQVYMRTGQDCSDLTAYCVVVEAYDHGATSWQAITTSVTKRVAHLQLNSTQAPWNRTPRQQQTTLCHELAHALGAHHPDGTEPAGTRGCIAAPTPATQTPLPTAADMANVQAMTTGWGAFTWWQQQSAAPVQ